jgi:Saxitoxin biosynthesis operon protein SxtJ
VFADARIMTSEEFVAIGTLHEDLRREDQTTGPSDRKFGLTLGIVFALIAVVKLVERSHWGIIWSVLAVALIGCALLRPSLLSVPNALWLKLGLLLHRIVNPIIMAVLFFGTILPIGLLMRVLGKDPLRLTLDRAADSYWLPRSDERPQSEAMRQQF